MWKRVRAPNGASQESISIALAEDGRTGEVRSCGRISHDLHALEKVMYKLRKEGPEGRDLRVCYSRTERDRPRLDSKD